MNKLKILVISHNSFSKTSNNGKTLESIFSAVDKDDLAQIYFSNNELPDFEYCNRYFKIADMDVLKSLISLGSKVCGKPIINEVTIEDTAKNSFLFDFFKKLFKGSGFLRDFLWLTGKWKTNDLKKWCYEFSPDIVFFLGGNSAFSHEIALYLKGVMGVPLVTYFTDDYIINNKKTGLYSFVNNFFLERVYNKTIANSELLFTIGSKMSHEYSRYYDRDFLYIMNSVDYVEYNIPVIKNDELVVSYFGGLHLNRWKMLARFSSNLPSNVVLHIYTAASITPEIKEYVLNSGAVLKGFVTSDNIQVKMLESDFLLHVESDEDSIKSITKLSISTKIPEYLISGRPLIAFGPKDLASIQFVVDNNVGFYIDSCLSNGEIKNKLNHIMSDREQFVGMGYLGHQFAKKNLLKDKISTSFYFELNKLLNR